VANLLTDPNLVALWNFEAGDALNDDSKGANHLTAESNPVADAVNFKQGAASCDFEAGDSDDWTITDAALDAGFPLKNGDTTKKISVCCWIKPETDTVAGGMGLFCKGKYTGSTLSFFLRVSSLNEVTINVSADGTTYNTAGSGTIITAGKWYHIGATYDDAAQAGHIRVWDDDAQTVYDHLSDWSSAGDIFIAAGAVTIGAYELAGVPWNQGFWDGLIDEMAVFNRILTSGEIDAIRGGALSGAAGPGIMLGCNI